MKILFRFCSLFLFFVGISVEGNAQTGVDLVKVQTDSVQFKMLDRYSVSVVALSALVLPGLGHIYCDEKKRGYSYMAGFAGSIAVTAIGVSMYDFGREEGSARRFGATALAVGIISLPIVYFSSFLNALTTAGRKNKEYREIHSKQIGYTILPAVLSTPSAQYYPGISLRLNF